MQSALNYIKQGISIVPIPLGKKFPEIEWKEYQNRLATEDEIKSWFGNQDKNIGIVTGKMSGITVVDVDLNKGGNSSLSELGIASLTTAISGHGLHLYFKYSDDERIKTVVKMLPGIDIRSEGGIIVAPPSLHETGKRYTWQNGIPISKNRLSDFPLEKFLLYFTKESLQRKSNKEGWITEVLNDLTSGKRHQQFAKVIGKLNSTGWSSQDIITMLTPHATDCNFDLTELEKQVKSMCERYKDQVPKPVEDKSLKFTSTEIFDNVTEVEWLVEGLIPDESLTFLVGDPKGKKSWFALETALSVAMGKKVAGRFSTRKGTVLYIQLEDGLKRLAPRYHKLVRGYGSEPDKENFVTYVGFELKLSNPDYWNMLLSKCREISPTLIVIDTLARSHNANENNTQEMSLIVDKLCQLRDAIHCSVLIVHHLRKESYMMGKPTKRVMRGNNVIEAAAESILTVCKDEKDDNLVYTNVVTKCDEEFDFAYKLEDSFVNGDKVVRIKA